MTQSPSDWEVVSAQRVLDQFERGDLAAYSRATRLALRRQAIATLAAAGVEPATPDDDPPVARVVDTWTSRKGHRLIAVECPLCGRKHVHGWPWVDAIVGHRVAHCHRRDGAPGGGYIVATPDGAGQR